MDCLPRHSRQWSIPEAETGAVFDAHDREGHPAFLGEFGPGFDIDVCRSKARGWFFTLQCTAGRTGECLHAIVDEKTVIEIGGVLGGCSVLSLSVDALAGAHSLACFRLAGESLARGMLNSLPSLRMTTESPRGGRIRPGWFCRRCWSRGAGRTALTTAGLQTIRREPCHSLAAG